MSIFKSKIETGDLSGVRLKAYNSAVVLLLLLIPFFAIRSLSLKSATFDEPINLVYGIHFFHNGDVTAPVDYPPLTRILTGAVADIFGPPIHYGSYDIPWAPGIYPRKTQEFLYRDNNADALIFWGRMPFVLLHMVLAVAVFAWSHRCWGKTGALISLLCCALSPSLLAHSRLIASDFAATAFIFLASYFLFLLSSRLTLFRIAMTGLFLGLAMLSKYSALLCGPVFFLILGAKVFFPGIWEVSLRRISKKASGLREKLWIGLAGFHLVFLISLLVVWSFYGFRYHSYRNDDPKRFEKIQQQEEFWREKTLESPVQNFALKISKNLKIFPEPFLMGIQFTFKHMEKRLSFFLGERNFEGNSWYFPTAFFLKTPLGVILLLLLATIGLRMGSRPLSLSAALCLFTFPAIYFALAVSSSINLGHRYILPIYPFLFVFIGGSAALLQSTPVKKGLLAAALLWFTGSSLAIHPDYIAYFNELAGGPKGGIRYLGDSNLDWGQDLKRLKPWMDKHGVRKIKLGYFGTALPEYYDIPFEWLPSVGFLNDQSGTKQIFEGDYLAVSATCRQGFYFDKMDQYKFLEDFEPVDHIGYSIYIYHITPERLKKKYR